MINLGVVCCGAVAVLVVTGCASSGPLGESAAANSNASAATDQQWCAAYASLTRVLANADGVAGGGAAASSALDRFDALWARGVDLGLVNQAQADANVRSIAGYRAIVDLRTAGVLDTDARVVAARAALQHQTEADREDLKASAAAVRSHCGAPTSGEPTTSPS